MVRSMSFKCENGTFIFYDYCEDNATEEIKVKNKVGVDAIKIPLEDFQEFVNLLYQSNLIDVG